MQVLIAEDDPISQRVLQSTLTKWGYEVIVCSNGQDAWGQLQQSEAPRLAVLDWMMPDLDGPEICRRVREMDGGEYYYLLLLTARGQTEDIVTGLEAGADDYVIKPFNSRELRVRIRCGRRIIELQNELLAARDELSIQATHDSMTGLLNRAAVLEEMEKEHSRAMRHDTPVSVIMLDLDHFKRINDTYGHAAGDCVIKEASRRMVAQTRGYDTVGRYGGEEFLIVLPETSIADATMKAQSICEALRQGPFDIGEDQRVPVTASLGVASTETLGAVSMGDLVRVADRALYTAKHEGRDRVATGTRLDQPVESL